MKLCKQWTLSLACCGPDSAAHAGGDPGVCLISQHFKGLDITSLSVCARN